MRLSCNIKEKKIPKIKMFNFIRQTKMAKKTVYFNETDLVFLFIKN